MEHPVHGLVYPSRFLSSKDVESLLMKDFDIILVRPFYHTNRNSTSDSNLSGWRGEGLQTMRMGRAKHKSLGPEILRTSVGIHLGNLADLSSVSFLSVTGLFDRSIEPG